MCDPERRNWSNKGGLSGDHSQLCAGCRAGESTMLIQALTCVYVLMGTILK